MTVGVAPDVHGLLGLARRAGAVAPGTEAVREAIRTGSARLVLLAEDASPGQLDKVRRTLRKNPVRAESVGDRAALGAAVGLAPISALALTSESFAEQVYGRLVGRGASGERDAATVAQGATAGEA